MKWNVFKFSVCGLFDTLVIRSLAKVTDLVHVILQGLPTGATSSVRAETIWAAISNSGAEAAPCGYLAFCTRFRYDGP